MQKLQVILVGILKALIVIFLSAHLFGIHARLLWHLNPDKIITEGANLVFSFGNFSENNITSLVFAGAYSVATVLILVMFDAKKKLNVAFMIVYALLDGAGVMLYYNTKITDLTTVGSVYYACYTIVIFLAVGFLKFIEHREPQEAPKIGPELTTEQKVLELLKEGKKQAQIAQELGVSQPYVSKIKSKHND
jgi:hypothetical protein